MNTTLLVPEEPPVPEVPSITCPRCGCVSQHPDDIANNYCGCCHWPTSDPVLGPHQPEPPRHANPDDREPTRLERRRARLLKIVGWVLIPPAVVLAAAMVALSLCALYEATCIAGWW